MTSSISTSPVQGQEISLLLNNRDIDVEVKFDIISRIVIEAQRKFQEQDKNISINRETLEEAQKTIKILDDTVVCLTENNAKLNKETGCLKSEIRKMKNERLKELCLQEKNALTSQKCSLIHRQRAAYAGCALLSLTVIGAVSIVPIIKHGLDLTCDMLRIEAKMKALQEVPECLMFPEVYQMLTDAYYASLFFQRAVDQPVSKDIEDTGHWSDSYEMVNEMNIRQKEMADKSLQRAIWEAGQKTRSYYVI